jgi:hypothetical protein
MEPTNATFLKYEALVPNPKLRLREQVHEVMRAFSCGSPPTNPPS